MHPIIPLLQLVKTLGKIEGRKRLQKLVHILQELGAAFPERFQYSFYGMYSLQLKREIETLKSENLVTEYRLNASVAIEGTPEFGELVTTFEIPTPPWMGQAKQLNKLSPTVLEGISTILYLRHTEIDEEIVRERLLILKPHLSDFVDECFSEAEKLKKVA